MLAENDPREGRDPKWSACLGMVVSIVGINNLHQLLSEARFMEFFQTPAFEEMLLKVAVDDVASFRNNNKWLKHHPADALVFKDLEKIWSELTPTYKGDFQKLIYGNFPGEQEVLQTLKSIRERLNSIAWTINV